MYFSLQSIILHLYQYIIPLFVVFNTYPLVFPECSGGSVAFDICLDGILTLDVLNTSKQALQILFNNIHLEFV